MDYLLDSHVLIWFINGDNQLSKKAIGLIKNINNRCYVSVATIWEIAIKVSLNKLELNGGFDDISKIMNEHDFEMFPMTFGHFQKLIHLEYHHRDPFDRIIIAQAMVENIPIISIDSNFNLYPVRTIWR